MCREGAWAELAAEVTFMVRIQSKTPGKIWKQKPDFYEVRFLFLYCGKIGNHI